MNEGPTPARLETLRLRGALYDRVTGLPALPLLFDDLRAFLDRRRAVGLLHISISNLDLVERVYGWQAFDRIVARQAAHADAARGRLLTLETRFALTGIHGGEVIAAVPERTDGQEIDGVYLQQLAREMESRMREAFSTEEFSTLVPRLEPRVGFAMLSENPFFRFERLVYRALDEARSRPRTSDERRRRSWGEEMQQVIRDEGISVHFQPVVELETLEIMGYEALSRGPAGSALESPAVMFEISREAGLAAELDRLCRKLALASARGITRGRKMFLNTRLDHLADPDWSDSGLEESLARLELAPADLVLEIAEPGASVDESVVATLLGDLRRRGFRLAIDDIGTGYAGVRCIERLRPDYLKIDISLVRRIDSSPIQQDLLASLVSIGRRIGAAVIAEGIEREAELDVLRRSGARYGQGFLFSAAVPSLLAGPMSVGKES